MHRLHSKACRLAPALVVTLLALGPGCSDDSASPSASPSPSGANEGTQNPAGRPGTETAPDHDGGVAPSVPDGSVDGSVADGGGVVDAAHAADAAPPPPVDPCPNLPIPGVAFNRNVLYREWSLSATGDGTYFASQAPYRLGFTRVQNRIWIMKFRTEANSYRGRMSAGADSDPGLAWISNAPDDANWALKNNLVSLTPHGTAMLDFLVIKDDADANTVATNSAFAQLRGMPTLRGDHCYYFGYENVSTLPSTAIDASFWSSADECGATGNGTCWYLGLDVNHYLHDPGTGATIAANVIPGLTH